MRGEVVVNKHIDEVLYYTITGDMIRKAFNFPDSAVVVFRVPGGGDWSGMNVEIEEDTPIKVTISKKYAEEYTIPWEPVKEG